MEHDPESIYSLQALLESGAPHRTCSWIGCSIKNSDLPNLHANMLCFDFDEDIITEEEREKFEKKAKENFHLIQKSWSWGKEDWKVVDKGKSTERLAHKHYRYHCYLLLDTIITDKDTLKLVYDKLKSDFGEEFDLPIDSIPAYQSIYASNHPVEINELSLYDTSTLDLTVPDVEPNKPNQTGVQEWIVDEERLMQVFNTTGVDDYHDWFKVIMGLKHSCINNEISWETVIECCKSIDDGKKQYLKKLNETPKGSNIGTVINILKSYGADTTGISRPVQTSDVPYFGERRKTWSELTDEEKKLRLKELVNGLNDITAEELISLGNSLNELKSQAMDPIVKGMYSKLFNVLNAFYRKYDFITKKEEEILSMVNKHGYDSTLIDLTPPNEIIPGFLVEGTHTEIIAVRGCGKTTMVADLVVGLETGTEILGGVFKVPKPVKTLTIICEGLRNDIPRKTMNYHSGLSYLMLDASEMEIPDIQLVLNYYIKTLGVKVVTFDSHTVFAEENTNNINDNNQVSAFMKATVDYTVKLGASVVVTLHASTKSEAITAMGANAFEKKASHIFRLAPVKDSEGMTKGTQLLHTKNRYGRQLETRYFTLNELGIIKESEEVRDLYQSQQEGNDDLSPEEKRQIKFMERQDLLITEWHNVKDKHGEVTHKLFAEQMGHKASYHSQFIKPHLDLFEVSGGVGKEPKVYVLKESEEDKMTG